MSGKTATLVVGSGINNIGEECAYCGGDGILEERGQKFKSCTHCFGGGSDLVPHYCDHRKIGEHYYGGSDCEHGFDSPHTVPAVACSHGFTSEHKYCDHNYDGVAHD